MLGQLSITCLRLWSTVQLDKATGAIGPPRSSTWHYFQLIQQPLNTAAWTSGLFLFHKDHLNAVLCKQTLRKELTISVSEFQLCSLFPVSFSNCRGPLSHQQRVLPCLLRTKERPKLEITELGIFFPEDRDLWSNSCHLIDRLNPSYWAHQLGLSLQFLGVLHFLFIWSLSSTYSGLVVEARIPSVGTKSKISPPPEKLSRKCLLSPPGNLRCDSTRRQILHSVPSFSNRFAGSTEDKMVIVIFYSL